MRRLHSCGDWHYATIPVDFDVVRVALSQQLAGYAARLGDPVKAVLHLQCSSDVSPLRCNKHLNCYLIDCTAGSKHQPVADQLLVLPFCKAC